MRTAMIVASMVLTVGCSARPSLEAADASAAADGPITAESRVPQPEYDHAAARPPQLWSHHERLTVSAEVCAARGLVALNALSFTAIVRNGTYVYGNHGNNRAAVKCVPESTESAFLYLAVAGPDRDAVESLRNRLAWSF